MEVKKNRNLMKEKLALESSPTVNIKEQIEDMAKDLLEFAHLISDNDGDQAFAMISLSRWLETWSSVYKSKLYQAQYKFDDALYRRCAIKVVGDLENGK